jgi:bacillithiol system protein YtxJ
VVLDRFDHHSVLKVRTRNLHSAAGSDARMRNVAVAADFVRGIDNDHPLYQLGREYACAFPQERRLADAGPAQQQQAFSGFDHVTQDIDSTEYGPADAARQTDNDLAPVTDCGYAMQRAFNACAIVLRESANTVSDIIDVFARDRGFAQIDGPVRKPALGLTAEIHNNLDEAFQVNLPVKSLPYIRRHHSQEQFQIVSDFLARQFTSPPQGGICYPENMVVELRQDQDFEQFLERSKADPVIIFKHSTQCSISGHVYRDFTDFADSVPRVESAVVLVIENRRLSNAIAERFGIRHESPQALIIKDGLVVWHASHWSITAESLSHALGSYAEPSHQRN